MKAKRFISLLIVMVLCLSPFTAFAEEAVSQEESINYSDISNWAYWNEGAGKAADLFFVCPTVDMGKGGNYNADITNEKYRESFIGAINMELGIYNRSATVYAPYYRQATFPVYSLEKEEMEKYLSFAYEDVKKAFIYYAEHTDASRPLILAGFSQGADLVIRLMKDLFDEPKYQRRLVAAYCIGWKLTDAEVAEYPHLQPAKGEKDTGVIIAFNSEDKDVTSSLMIGENEKTYAINPLNWKTTSEIADKTLNKGACFTDYSGNVNEEIPSLTGAYIDEKRGALKVTDIKPEDYPAKLFDDGIYHLYDYQFFYRNLQENVAKRLAAYNRKYADRVNVYYNDEILIFDVEPIIESGRTLVPFRTIFETMGCAVNYTVDATGKQIVSARRGNDNLILTIGENKMYFNGEEKVLDVPAKIKGGRTIIPLRAVSEAFECAVQWQGDTKTVYIYSPAECHTLSVGKLLETITDDKGNVLIEAIAYYPIFDNPTETSFLDEITEDYKWEAEKFIEEAKAKKEEAIALRNQMGADAFKPFLYELTFEQTYNVMGNVSFTNYKYVNVGGAHPATAMESRSFSVGLQEELSLSAVIDEDVPGVSLTKYVTNLFVEKIKELDPEAAKTYTYDYVFDYVGYTQFYLTNDSVVLYFNQGEVLPYAFGVISVEIPYDPDLFYLDMSGNCLDEYVCEYEYDKGYEWRVIDYSKENISLLEESTDYPPEEIYSEYYPVGLKKITIKGIEKGNAGLILAHVKKGEGLESATLIYAMRFYIDENNRITVVADEEGTFLLN